MSNVEMITEETIGDGELRQQTSAAVDQPGTQMDVVDETGAEDDVDRDDETAAAWDAGTVETTSADDADTPAGRGEPGADEDGVNESGAADDNVSETTTQAGKQRKPTGSQYNCTSCSRSFNTRRDLVTHQYMHRENPTAFCSVCQKSFSSESAYRRHAASHNRKTASSRRPRKTCSQCTMQFDTMKQLSAHHAAKHVDEKRFVCAICGSQFAWPENLRAHQRTHQLDPHECDICGRRFVDATSLRVHLRNSHGPTSSETATQRKQHCCKLCGRSFQFDFSLRAHMKGHAQSPVAATLHRLKQHYPDSKLTAITPRSAPTQTRYVHVDSKGVIDLDLGMAVGESAVNEPREIIVEVYNTLTNQDHSVSADGQQNSSVSTMDFSDVLDQSQGMTQPDTDQRSLQTDHRSQQDSVAADNSFMPVLFVRPDSLQQTKPAQPNTTTTTAVTATTATTTLSSMPVWYTKPDNVQQTEPIQPTTTTTTTTTVTTTLSAKPVWYVRPDDAQQTETSAQLQLQQSEMTEEGDGENLNSVAAADDPATTTTDTTTAIHTAADAVVDSGGLHEAADTNVQPSTTTCQDDEDIDDVDDAEHDEEPAVPQQPMMTDVPTTAQTVTIPPGHSPTGSTEDGYRDVLDWMMTDVEPVPQRAAPFIFRQTTASSRRRATARVREPFLFNCIMTDEKPFVCMTCGQCFRWEISLNIHHRVHTDGTFPNKSRGRATTQSGCSKSPRCGDSGSKALTPRSSSIVKHRRTSSSEEDDDEFTFHVHADGPSQVSRKPPQRGQGRGRGQGSGRGSGVVVCGRPVTVTLPTGRVVIVKPRQQSDASAKMSVKTGSGTSGSQNAGCNGVGITRHRSSVSAKSRHCRAALRACYVCLRCTRVVTSLASFQGHQRRAHFTTQLSCESCTAHFTSHLDLRRHCQQLHITGVSDNMTKCQRCRRVFSDSRRLQQHVALHHTALCHKAFLSTTQ